LARPVQLPAQPIEKMDNQTGRSSAMNTNFSSKNTVKNVVCMLLAALIVSSGLVAGVAGAHVAEREARLAVFGQV
jgi:hypothetical protein